jgi:hypothetical protein
VSERNGRVQVEKSSWEWTGLREGLEDREVSGFIMKSVVYYNIKPIIRI